eukprot:c46050_g1_i1 orf=90-245(+)
MQPQLSSIGSSPDFKVQPPCLLFMNHIYTVTQRGVLAAKLKSLSTKVSVEA